MSVLGQMMTSSVFRGDRRCGPLYFFDQPTRKDLTKRASVLTQVHFDLINEGVRLATTTKSGNDAHTNDKTEEKSEDNSQLEQRGICSKSNAETLEVGEKKVEAARGDSQGDGFEDINLLESFKRVAPRLLSELSELLLQYQESEQGYILHGLVNVLNYSWEDLTSGAAYMRKSKGAKLRKSKGSDDFSPEVEVNVIKKLKKNARMSEKTTTERNTEDHNAKKKTCVPIANKAAQLSTTISFSMSSKVCQDQGWLVQPKELTWKEPRWNRLCQWAVERLQLANIPIKLQAAKEAEQGLNNPPILRYYGKDTSPVTSRRAGGPSLPAPPLCLGNGLPQLPEPTEDDPSLHKLHFRINDRSSFIYYPSGHVAVCQSHSGMLSGGFWTHVFSDSASPVLLASITAFGHGSATDATSGSIIAAWDPNGGMTCDPDGTVTKEWTWQTGSGRKENIVLQISDQICVRLLSGTSATLCFKMNSESVKLPLPCLPTKETACLQSEGHGLSPGTQDMSLGRKTGKAKSDNVERKSSALESLRVVREAERSEETSPSFRGGRESRELRRLQRRVKNILYDWLEFYRVATGIRCPDIERMSKSPKHSKLKRELGSEAQPTLNPADSNTDSPEGGSKEKQPLPRYLPAPGDVLVGSSPKLTRRFPPKLMTEEHHHIIQTGALRVHSNVKLDSVILKSPDQQTSRLIHQPSHNTPCPSSPCPAQLRAVLQGGEGHRLCRCSSRLMPVVTDLEYDAFISGQPPHSEQILVVCASEQRQPLATSANQDLLEQLYERMNKNRTMPCTQCQLDSFRLVRYEMSTGTSCARPTWTALLHHRHNASPGMFLMYIKGRLLFADYIFNGYSCSERDLQKQITKTRADYRQGHSLPSDYLFSAQVKRTVVGDLSLSQEPHKPPWKGQSQTCDRKPTHGRLTLKKEKLSKAKKSATPLPLLTP